MASSWRQVSDVLWNTTQVGVGHEGKLYVVDSGKLLAVDPSTGDYEDLGIGEDWDTRLICAADWKIYTIEGNGGLYRTDPLSSTCEQLNDQSWSSATALAEAGGRLYTTDQNGKIYSIDPFSGEWREEQGARESYSSRCLFSIDGALFSLEEGGELITCFFDDHGSAGSITYNEWPGVNAIVPLEGSIYESDQDGHFYVIRPSDPSKLTWTWEALEIGTRWDTRLLFAAGGRIYTIENSGGLFEVIPY